MGDSESSANSSIVSIFGMILLVIVVIAILYFVVYRGFFSKKTEVDINVNPGGSYKMLDKNDKGLAFNNKQLYFLGS